MHNSFRKVTVAVSAFMAVMAYGVAAGAQSTDPIVNAIDDTRTSTLEYAGLALAAVVAVVMVAVGIRIVPKVVRAVAARVTG